MTSGGKKDFHKISACRVCDHKELKKILDLKKTPLANSFVCRKNLKKKEDLYPLDLYYCPKCFLVQLGTIVRPSILFKNYQYLTSASKPLVDHFENLAKEISQKFIKFKEDLVIEIGSNDGALLAKLAGKTRVLGVDPAKNIAKIAVRRNLLRRKGYTVLRKYINRFPIGITGAFIFKKYQDDMSRIEDEIKNILNKIG